MLPLAHLALCLPLSAANEPVAQGAPPPNVLLVISDDQAWGDYSFLGHPSIETPRLDQLAMESLTYTRGYVAAPLCRPSLASMFLGVHPHEHGITGNDPSLPKRISKDTPARLDPETIPYYEALMQRIEQRPGLANLLGDKGYLTLQTGKWWEGSYERGGFSHGMTHGDPRRGGRHGDVGLEISRKGLEPVSAFLDQAEAEERPFFIWHAPFLPHTPHNPPTELFEKYQQRTDSKFVARYWAMCEWFDQTCGELLDLLEARGLSEDTLVVYITDNGWIQRPNSGRFAGRSKRTPYEGGVRTPIMLRWPGRIEAHMDKETAVSSIDLAPTILAACGIAPPEDMAGLDLRDRAAVRARPAVFGAAYAHDVPEIEDFTAGLEARFIVSGRWKLLVHEGENGKELFDLHADPREERNLTDAEPTIVREMAKQLDAWWPGRN